MKVKIACSNCSAKLNVPKKLLGKRIACPGCKQKIELKAPTQPPPESSGIDADKKTSAKVDLADRGGQVPTPWRARSQHLSSKRKKKKKRKSSRSSGKGLGILSALMVLIIGSGGLLSVGAVYLHFFGNPFEPQAVAQNEQPEKDNPATISIDLPQKPLPVAITEIKPQEILVPSLKMFTGEVKAAPPEINKISYQVNATSEYPRDSQFRGLPEPLHYRGKVSIKSKKSTNFPIDSRAQSREFFPPQTFASGLRLPEGRFLVPTVAIQYADFVTAFDGEKHELVFSRIIKRGKCRILVNNKRPNFPRVRISNKPDLDGDTKDVSLIWVDRNSQLHILENLDVIGFDSESKDVTFEAPDDSVGGIIVDHSGRIAAMVTKAENGNVTATQLSEVLPEIPQGGAELFDFVRTPVSKDKAGMLSEAAACLARVHCKRTAVVNQLAFDSNIEVMRGSDQTSKKVFVDQYHANFKENGQVSYSSAEADHNHCRLPGFLGHPGMASVIEFPEKPGKSEWRIEKTLKLGTPGNERVLVPNTVDTNELSQVKQIDEYRVIQETEEHLIIERNYLAQSARTKANQRTLQWDIPAGFPFRVEGKFTYRYDKSLKLATSVVFEGVEQKNLSEDVVAPLKLSFEITSTTLGQGDESKAN